MFNNRKRKISFWATKEVKGQGVKDIVIDDFVGNVNDSPNEIIMCKDNQFMIYEKHGQPVQGQWSVEVYYKLKDFTYRKYFVHSDESYPVHLR